MNLADPSGMDGGEIMTGGHDPSMYRSCYNSAKISECQQLVEINMEDLREAAREQHLAEMDWIRNVFLPHAKSQCDGMVPELYNQCIAGAETTAAALSQSARMSFQVLDIMISIEKIALKFACISSHRISVCKRKPCPPSHPDENY